MATTAEHGSRGQLAQGVQQLPCLALQRVAPPHAVLGAVSCTVDMFPWLLVVACHMPVHAIASTSHTCCTLLTHHPTLPRYDTYLGTNSSAHVLNSSNYQTGSIIPTRKYGWSAYMCSSKYPSICEVPAQAFPCSQPPVESPSPPSPPVPPSPPSPPNCEASVLQQACCYLRTWQHAAAGCRLALD